MPNHNRKYVDYKIIPIIMVLVLKLNIDCKYNTAHQKANNNVQTPI